MKSTNLFILPFIALILSFVACEDDNQVAITNNNNPATQSCIPESLQGGLLATMGFRNLNSYEIPGNAILYQTTTVSSAADRNGNPGCARQFSGNDNSYMFADETEWLNDLGQFSIAMWYKPMGVQAGYELLVGRGSGFHCPDTNGEWSVGLYDGRRAVFGHGNSVWENAPAAGTDGEWKFLAVTCNKTGNVLSMYIDGQLMDTKSGFADCGSGPVGVNDTGYFYIGKNFNGMIDDIAIYSKVLTASEIAALHNLAPCCEQ